MIGTKIQCITYLANVPDDDKKYEVKEHKERRSLNQNSYYWNLCGKVAVKTKISTARIHNENLRSLGLYEYIEDRLVTVYLPDTDAAENQTLESTTYHIKPTSQTRTGRDGVTYRTYVMLRGSHTFNTVEMSALLDMMIEEAKAQDIETLTPDELARMRLNEEQKNKSN